MNAADATLPLFASDAGARPPETPAAPVAASPDPETPASGASTAPARLRRSQWNAVRALDGHVLVTAGAGTGKTFTVVSAMLYLLGIEIDTPDGPSRAERPLELHEIAAITFTNQAAADLKRALRAALRKHGRRDLARRVDGARVGTIHGFCGDVLREFALRTGRDPALRVMEEGEAAARLRAVARDTLVSAMEGSSADARALLERHAVRDVEGWIAALLEEPDGLAELRGSARLESHARALAALADDASRALERSLDAAGEVDYDRMILWTRDLLRDDPRALRTLRRRIRVLIIDEFQDVDPVQKDIAYRLGGLDVAAAAVADVGGVLHGGRTTAPRRAGPPPENVTRLFLVGDPKQSIYRFRRADVTVWRRVERDFQGGAGSVVALDESFRSVPEVLGWVDATSGAQLDRPVDGAHLEDFEVPYLPLEPTRPPAGGAPVEILVVGPDERGKRASNAAARRAEARWIAERAHDFHAHGVPWREMAVLLPAWANVAYFEEGLRAAGVPAYVLRGEGFLERREVVDLITALQAIRTPRDDRALLGFLRGPFVGVRDDTLLRVARHAARPYWQALAAADGVDAPEPAEAGAPGSFARDREEAARLAAGIRLLHDLGALRDRVPIASLLEELLDRTGYLAHLALAGASGLEAIANVRQFLASARSSADRSVGDFLADVAERRAREKERASREMPARLYAEDDDVLTIGTIHGAKGLEWDVVFCADIARPPRGEQSSFLRTADGLLLEDPDTEPDARSEAWRAAAERARAEDRAEKKRQWYVAQTRARSRLLLASVPLGQRPSSGTFARDLVEEFAPLAAAFERDPPADGAPLTYVDHAGAEWTARVAVRPPARSAPDAAASPWGREKDHGRDAGPAGPVHAGAASADVPEHPALMLPPPPLPAAHGPLRLSATQMLTRSRCETRHRLKYTLRIPEPDAERHAAADELIRGVVRGRIVHDVLHRYRDPEELADVIEVAIGRWDEDAPPPESGRGMRYRAELREEVERVLARPEYAALRDADGARRELPFLQVHGDGRSTEGAIDLAVPPDGDAAGWRLLDVKTNRLDAADAPAAASRYAPQRDAYVGAAESISGRPVESFTFVFSAPGVALAEAPPADAGAAAAAAREAIAVGARPRLADDPAECLFCGYRVVGLCPGVIGGGEPTRADAPAGSQESPGAPAVDPARSGADRIPAPDEPPGGQLRLL